MCHMYYVCFASLTADRSIVHRSKSSYAHLITIRTKTVTNTVIVLKDTITKFKTKNSTKNYRTVQATNMKAYATLLIPTNNWTDDFL